jgi:hypothetical protein
MLDPTTLTTLTAVAEDRMQAAREAAARGQLHRPRGTGWLARRFGRSTAPTQRDASADELELAA